MHAISLFVCWWFANGTLLHAFCTFSFWTKSKPLNWNRRREKNMKGASELYWTKWSMLSGLTVYEQEKGREKGVRESPLYLFFFSLPLFFFYCEVYLSAAPLQCSQSSLTTEDMFSLCEIQSLWYAGKLLFSTPNCCLWEASVKNSFSFQSEFDKSSKMKSACSYFPITRLCMRIRNLLVREVSFFLFFFFFSLLWSANVQNVCNSRHKKSRWISQLNRTIIKLYRHTELWGVQPNYYSFEKHWCYSGLIQNGRRCQEYICFLNSECTTHAGENFARFVGQRSVVPSVVTLNWWHWLTVGVRNEHFSSTQRKSLKSNIQAISPFENWLLVFPLSRVMNIPWESEQHD